MQADTVATASSIDQTLVDEVAKLGFERQLIIDSVTNRLQVHFPPPLSPQALDIFHSTY